MPRFKKRILAPGTYNVNGEDVTLDTDRFKSWVRSYKRVRSEGFNVPAPFYHDKNAVPVRAKPNAKDKDAYNNGGWWERLWVSKKDGALWGEVDVPNEEKARKIEEGEIKEVSPAVIDGFDLNGGRKVKGDVISHIAFVTQPVAGKQQPFEIAACRTFSRTMCEGEPEESNDVRWCFQMTGEKPTVQQLNAAEADLSDVLEVLEELGMTLPQDTTEANFAERVTTAALALKAGGVGQLKEQKTPPHQSAAYSRDSNDKEKDMAEDKTPVENDKQDEAQLELSRKYEATKKFAEATATKSLVARVNALDLSDEFKAKHITPLMENHELQFSREGEIVPGTLDIVLDVLEDLPKPDPKQSNPFFMSRMVGSEDGQLQQPPPDPKSAPKTQEEADELISRIPAIQSRLMS